VLKPITIIGGGLAGLALGILLRREGAPVVIREAGAYPRHRVCGEFISGEGRAVLRELGWEEELLKGRAVEAREAAFFWRGRRIAMALPEAALCVSRFVLDRFLAVEFQRLGGELRVMDRAGAEASGKGVVRATGRRRAENGAGFLFGLKAHAREANLSADLELHFRGNSYVGICRLPGGGANVCGLFYSRRALPNLQKEWATHLGQAVTSAALAGAGWDEQSCCSVAGLTVAKEEAGKEFSVGDSAAMIPPLTGNGMSMAFESAVLASAALRRYCAGSCGWDAALREYRRAWGERFGRRLRWASFVQRLVFNSQAQGAFFLMAKAAPLLPNLLFARTR
jgi:flavin-dependent dehydrogenase